ncbi:type II secretion system protein [Paenibacillus koleovorans]|uniref:type II secretion system protein n=1 Tax=Paenibacillus koleovorans TaxID=121608 RepID=UPI0013E2AE5A|nr:type II secretion system protein [Paenibacillus koleovorans]
MLKAIMNFKWKLSRNQKGMTLIELMAVVVILGVVAAVAGAAVTGGFSSSKTNTDNASIKVITDALQRYTLDKDEELPASGETVAQTLTRLVTNGYLSSAPAPVNGSAFTITYANSHYTVAVAP